MLKIIIKSTKLFSEKTAKGNLITKQQAAFDNGTDFPQPFFLVVDNPYPVGAYQLTSQSFRVNQWQSLELDPYKTSIELIK